MKNKLPFVKLFFLIGLIFSFSTVYSQTATPPATGDGSESNPYQIANLDNLYWLTQDTTVWDDHFIQTADINASATSEWNSGLGFDMIGNDSVAFKGNYDGQSFTIDSLVINRPNESYVAFFKKTVNGAIVKNLGLTNFTITGLERVGGLFSNCLAEVSNCYTTGAVTANQEGKAVVGGFAAGSYYKISNSYSNVNVSATVGNLIGGFVGTFGSESVIKNSYSFGTVSGNKYVGGFLGTIGSGASVQNCYSTAQVDYNAEGGGFAGASWFGSEVANCFWDKELSGMITSGGGTGLTSSEMKSPKNYLNKGWDFYGETTNGSNDFWATNYIDNDGYPFLSWENYPKSSAPLSSVSSLIISDISSGSFVLESYTAPTYGGADGYVAFINAEDSWNLPADGETPVANTVWQNNGQQCIYNGTSTTPNVSVTGLDANTEYFIKILAYNETDGNPVYELIGALKQFFTMFEEQKPDGDGSTENPYQIANLDNLAWIMLSDTAWDKNFIQTADIDARETYNWLNGTGFTPIGNNNVNFTGSYHGQGHIIDSLLINQPTETEVGFFGIINNSTSVIDSLGLTNISVKAKRKAGAMIGYLLNGTVNHSYTTGSVIVRSDNEYGYAGGFVGINEANATINNCYANVNVDSESSYSNYFYYAGGFISYNLGTVVNCYSSGNVIGEYKDGGFIGDNTGEVINCFWDKESSGLSGSDGGTGLSSSEMKNIDNFLQAGWDFLNESFNGNDDYWGINSADNQGRPFLSWQGYESETYSCQAPLATLEKVYTTASTTTITIDSLINDVYGADGGVIYINSVGSWTTPTTGDDPAANPVWQNDGQQCVYLGTSDQPDVEVTGLDVNTKYYIKAYAYSDCDGTKNYENTGLDKSLYTNVEGANRPNGDGTVDTPFEISNLNELIWFMYSDSVWNKHFIQTADINVSASENWNDGAGFVPIGNSEVKFTGTYNGNSQIIDSLYINRPSEDFIGLFGRVEGATARIDSLGLTNLEITGRRYVGGIVGYLLDATVNQSSTKGTIVNTNSPDWWAKVGGIAGQNSGIISSCFSITDITSPNSWLGGIAGINSNGEIKNSYALGTVTGTNWGRVGGLVGENSNGTITSCYSAAAVDCSDNATGGLVGHIAGTVKNSFWDKEASGVNKSAAGTGLTTAEMKKMRSFLTNGWDFYGETTNGTNDTWACNYKDNEGYPFLSWENYPKTCAPLTQASDMIISDNGTDQFTLESYTAASYDGADGYVIYMNMEDSWVAPADGEEPVANTTWQGNGQQCIYSGVSTTPNVVVDGVDLLCNSSNYFIKIYAYNECSGRVYETVGAVDSVEAKDIIEPVPDAASLDDITASCEVTELTAPTATDNCSGTITGTHDATFPVTATTTVTWTYTDEQGNSATQTQNIVIEDNIAPVADIAELETITGQCAVTVTEVPTATDNCSGEIIGTTTDSLTYDEVGNHTITWEYVDDNGNITTQEQTVVVNNDTENPVPDVTELETITGQCSATITNVPTATDNCSGTITATTTDPLEYTEQGNYTITWSYEDESGNISTQTQNVVIDDNTAPVADVTELETVTGQCAVTVTETPTATDNCSGTITATTTDPLEYTEQGNYTITWEYTDENGNISTQEQAVIVNDNIAPVPDAVTLADITAECEITELTAPTATDNCSGIIKGTHDVTFPVTATTIVTWTYTDEQGNSATQTQNVVIDDNTAPVADVAELETVTGQCTVTVTETPTATDNCSGTITATTTDPLEYTEQGNYTITWSYEDESGNISTQEQSVIVNDNTAPTISCVSDQTVELSAGESIYTVENTSLDPVSTDDNCMLDSVYNDFNNQSSLQGAEFEEGTTTVTWIAVDVNGNTSECSFDVTVNLSTGISDLTTAGISIYPNPVSDELTVKAANADVLLIEVFDMTGKIIYSDEMVSKTEKIDFSATEPGMYIIKVTTKKDIYTMKLFRK